MAEPKWNPISWLEKHTHIYNSNHWPCSNCKGDGLDVRMTVLAHAHCDLSGWPLKNLLDKCKCPRCGREENVEYIDMCSD